MSVLAPTPPAALEGRPPAPARREHVPAAGRAVPWWAIGLVVALAALVRFAGLGGTATDPFYDAAVRSMGGSWHALWTGAMDPSGQVAIDKPPVDLWLQVASTKLFGFSTPALLLPAALGGLLGVVALWDLVRTLAGPRAGLGASLGLAVLPAAVITARSDTMDAVMSALLVLAWALAARGLRRGDVRAIVAAGALVGLAFEVKLFEALIAVPGLALMWWLGAAGSRWRRAGGLGGAALAAVAVGLAWLVLMPLTVPAAQRPFAFGSTSGSAWQSALVYDGWDRLTGHGVAAQDLAAPTAAQRVSVPAAPGPLRLLNDQDGLAIRFGLFGLAALLIGAAVAAFGAWRGLDRAGRAGAAALASWAALGLLMASFQSGLRPRYLEAVDPAIAAVLGGGLVLLAARASAERRAAAVARPRRAAWAPDRRTARPARVPAARRGREHVAATRPGGPDPGRALTVLGGLLAAAALAVSAAAIARHTEDSGAPGALPVARLRPLRQALLAGQGTAEYELASLSVAKAGPIIVADDRPVLMLTAADGHPLVGPEQLAELVRAGAVRMALVGSPCTTRSPAGALGCSPDARWIRAHGIDVSRDAGQPRAGLLYRLVAGPPVAGPTGPPPVGPWDRRRRAVPAGGRGLRAAAGSSRPRLLRPPSAAVARRLERRLARRRPRGAPRARHRHRRTRARDAGAAKG